MADVYCPVCSGSSAPAFIGGDYQMQRCRSCGTAFVCPQPSDETLKKYYDSFHLSKAEGGVYDDADGRMQRDFGAKLARIIAKAGDKPGRLLDVGCGKGFFVKLCRDRGIDAQGIDLSHSGVEYATTKLGVPARCGDLGELKGQLGKFNVVTFWATIEHLKDPALVLRHIGEVMDPGGWLFLDTGVGDDWLDRFLPGVVQWYDPPQHMFVFSIPGMRKLLDTTGFAVERIEPCFERSHLRRWMRIVRNSLTAALLRLSATLGRLNSGGIEFTRYPMGNLMFIVARRHS